MPSLQLDLPLRLDAGAKRALARELGAVYAEVMQVRPELITVAIHDLGPGGVWRCGSGEPEPAALVMCDVRAGRPVATRERLARGIVEVCARACGLEEGRLKVEFTQHSGDEMFHPQLGGFAPDWAPGGGATA
ncbi:tautomerase family protein [Blastococcus xanthinilyticus]|uniref:Tautomerase-like protein n=1 Tax=Blastococcus xanthinilyticus TaxID=1564164 RepID=A0A5S5CNH0_9ACTN|nr:tautomerase family protein [Blastococcus xanthinilyticus]TYP84601.1 tautomerase-like protein [Blastococcus xanthinilyticus]